MTGLFGCCCSPVTSSEPDKKIGMIASPEVSQAPEREGGGRRPLEEDEHIKDSAKSGAGIRPQSNVSTTSGDKGVAAGGAAGANGSSKKENQPPSGPSPAAKGGASRDPAAQAELEAAEAKGIHSSRSVKSHYSMRSCGTSSTIGSEFINERIPARQREAQRIQQAVKTFARSMVRGQQMGVISPDGQLRTCSCSLDKKLKNFVIELKGSVRKIPLSEMAEVYQGKEPEDLETPLDDLCATVMLQSQECISFHFADIPAREHFAMCLQILVDGQQ
mmetsp:Transcript_10892/g.29098  ORF Transcript_10892/g.29098 Transcript_10892/m.29098 type:complete len:275 (+) Transcript_10892:163-987(+)